MVLALVGIVMALVLGAICRVFDIPLPAPPKIQGALLVVATTVGFAAASRLFG